MASDISAHASLPIERVCIPFSKAKTRKAAYAFLILFAIASYAAQSHRIRLVFSVISLGIFGLALVLSLMRYLSAKPGLIIDRAGLTDRVSPFGAIIFPWESISHFTVGRAHGSNLLGIHLLHPEEFIARQKGVSKWLMWFNYRLRSPIWMIASTSLEIQFDPLCALVIETNRASKSM